MLKHCLDCDELSHNTRCATCERAHNRALAYAGRVRRGRKWNRVSVRIRIYWEQQGRTCIDASDGLCRGRIQVDHIMPGSPVYGYAPRCAYHNARKGNRNGST